MIQSFKCEDTAALFSGRCVARFANIRAAAERKLEMLAVAASRSPPGNRLEVLGGDRKGQHSIRINDRWRVCFVWTADGPQAVEIVDYH